MGSRKLQSQQRVQADAKPNFQNLKFLATNQQGSRKTVRDSRMAQQRDRLEMSCSPILMEWEPSTVRHISLVKWPKLIFI